MDFWNKFVDSFGRPGGRSFLLASMWLFLLVLLFALRMRGIILDPDARGMIGDASKLLLGGLLLSLGDKKTDAV